MPRNNYEALNYYKNPSQKMEWEYWQDRHRADLADEFPVYPIWVRSKKDWRVAKVNPKLYSQRAVWYNSKYRQAGDLFNQFFFEKLPIRDYFAPQYA